MNWRSQFSDEEVREMIQDSCAAYQAGAINDFEFRQAMARLGINATEIAEMEKQYRPPVEDNSL